MSEQVICWRCREALLYCKCKPQKTLRPSAQAPAQHHRFEYGVRDKRSGEVQWRDLVSVRQAAKALGLILKHY